MKLTKVTIEIPEIWKKLIIDFSTDPDFGFTLPKDAHHKKPYLELIIQAMTTVVELPSRQFLNDMKISNDKWYKIMEVLHNFRKSAKTPFIKLKIIHIGQYFNEVFIYNPEKKELVKLFRQFVNQEANNPDLVKKVIDIAIDCMTILFDDGCRGLFVDEESDPPRDIPKIVFKDIDEISLEKYVETGEWFAAEDIDTPLKNHAVSRRLGTYVKNQPFEQDGFIIERKIGSPYKYRLVKKGEKKAEQLPLGLDA